MNSLCPETVSPGQQNLFLTNTNTGSRALQADACALQARQRLVNLIPYSIVHTSILNAVGEAYRIKFILSGNAQLLVDVNSALTTIEFARQGFRSNAYDAFPFEITRTALASSFNSLKPNVVGKATVDLLGQWPG